MLIGQARKTKVYGTFMPVLRNHSQIFPVYAILQSSLRLDGRERQNVPNIVLMFATLCLIVLIFALSNLSAMRLT